MSARAKKLQAMLEGLGHKNVRVWWEPISNGTEMGGPAGGWMFDSDSDGFGLGYTFEAAKENIRQYMKAVKP